MTDDIMTDICPHCDLPDPARNPYCFCSPKWIGIDIANGVETHVETTFRDGVLHVIEIYAVIDTRRTLIRKSSTRL